MRVLWREDDDLYRISTTRTAAVVLFSAAVLLLPRTAPIEWWAVIPAVVSLTGGCVVARLRVQSRPAFWPLAIAIVHQALMQAGAGFAGVAAGGVEGSQRPLSMLALVLTASYSTAVVVGIGWVFAIISVFCASTAAGLSAEVAFTVTVMFGASAAAVASIVHLLMTRIRRQTLQARLTATLAASVARAASFEEDLPEILALTSSVLGGATVALSRVDPGRIVVPLGAHESPTSRRVPRRQRERAFDEEVLVSVVDRLPFVLLVGWPTLAVRREVPPQTVAIVRDLLGNFVERAAQIARLEERTRTDPLTGLGNRRALAQWLVEHQGRGTVVMLDLDHFKGYNDSNGHIAGDQLLRRFSAVVRTHLRSGDCAVRLGGEEFCVALDAQDEGLGERFVVRLRRAFDADPGNVTFSAGVAVAQVTEPMERLLARADAALYEAKREGRNRTVVARAEPD